MVKIGALLLCALLALPSAAEDVTAPPTSPPVLPEGHRHLFIRKGDPAPVDGVFSDEAVAKYDLQRLLWYESYVESCNQAVTVEQGKKEWWPWLAGGAAGVALGVVAGLVLYPHLTVTK